MSGLNWIGEDSPEDGLSPAELQRAVDKALQHLVLRDHASGELYQKLTRKFEAPVAAAAMARIDELGLLDDAAFAVRRAAQLAQKGKSRLQIDRALAAAGISGEDRAAALDSLPQDEQQLLMALVQKKYAAKLAAGKQDAVAAALLRRGFAPGQVRHVLQMLTREEFDY